MNKKISTITKIAIFSAIAIVLYNIEFPIMFGHLKADPSLIPSVVAGVTMGPFFGVLVELIKNILHLPISSSAGIGELINFLVGTAMILPLAMIYRKNHTAKGYILASIVAMLSILSIGALCNYILTPPYMAVLGRPNPTHDEIMIYVTASFSLNFVKGLITMIPTYYIVKALQKSKVL